MQKTVRWYLKWSGRNRCTKFWPFYKKIYPRSVKTFDPSDPMYFTPGNWRFLPDSENYYNGMNKCHKCAGRRVGIKKRAVRPTVRAVGKERQFLTCPDTVESD